MGRRGYPPEFGQRVLDLLAAGRRGTDLARDLGISSQTIYVWRHRAVAVDLVYVPITEGFAPERQSGCGRL
jgi:transposase-like protein